jgi:hypothetical protein
MPGLGSSASGGASSHLQRFLNFLLRLADIPHYTQAFRDLFCFRRAGKQPKRQHSCYGDRYGGFDDAFNGHFFRFVPIKKALDIPTFTGCSRG